jgi:hypothetical protein
MPPMLQIAQNSANPFQNRAAQARRRSSPSSEPANKAKPGERVGPDNISWMLTWLRALETTYLMTIGPW